MSQINRQNISRSIQRFIGRVTNRLAFNDKPGVPCTFFFQYRAAPALAVANGYSASASVSSGVAAVLGGSLSTAGVGIADVPRNVVGAWTGTAIITITGTDQYGNVIHENSASGTSHTGKKAFSTITSIVPNANITGATFGTGAVVGLPYRVDESSLLAARFNNAIDAGTFVPADTTTATATTGDPYGTFAAAGTFNAVKVLSLLITCSDDSTLTGAYGVTPF